jgi:hypothetical protein
MESPEDNRGVEGRTSAIQSYEGVSTKALEVTATAGSEARRVDVFLVQGVQSYRQSKRASENSDPPNASGSTRSFGKESPDAGVRIPHAIKLFPPRDLACDLEPTLSGPFLSAGISWDLGTLVFHGTQAFI